MESDAKPMLGERMDRNDISQHGQSYSNGAIRFIDLRYARRIPTLLEAGETINVFD